MYKFSLQVFLPFLIAGSELAGETAAALASASYLFRSSDPTYSEKLLTHAKKLFRFADEFRGKYTDSIPQASYYQLI